MSSRIHLAGVTGIIFSTVVASFVILNPSVQGSPASLSSPTDNQSLQADTGLPVRLTIPKINVNAAVEYVGLTPDGAMDIPKSPVDVAWFEPGKRPGENGSAVIAGHFGWKNGTPAVFDDLSALRKGDMVYVTDDQGVTSTFIVRESRIYDQSEGASDVFGSSDGKTHLNLVTCQGVWNKEKKSYSKRLVVFTDKIE